MREKSIRDVKIGIFLVLKVVHGLDEPDILNSFWCPKNERSDISRTTHSMKFAFKHNASLGRWVASHVEGQWPSGL